MKLRNKQTGEIVSLQGELTYDDKVRLLTHYSSLAELNEEWEDYEEQKEYWYIGIDGDIYKKEYEYFNEAQDNIGNRFETKEEAEKAVEKLKALRRLKEAGFRTYDICQSPTGMVIHFDVDWKVRGVGDDLDLLFSQEVKNEFI